jgi:DNA-binding MarR family transcriptional regulator
MAVFRGGAAYRTRNRLHPPPYAFPWACPDVTKPEGVRRGAPLPLRRKVGRLLQALTKGSFVDADCELQESIELPFVADEVVAGAIAEWRARASYVPWDVSDPVWGILLELLEAEIQGRSASLSSIRNLGAVPARAADRSLKALERHALVVRRAHPLHSEDEIIGLSPKGSSALRRYFDEVVESRRRS